MLRPCPVSLLRALVFLSASVPLAALFVASPAVAGESPTVAVQILPGAPEIDPDALRDAVARELGEPVLEGADAASAAFTLLVSIDRQRGELVVERRDAVGGMSRRVPLPADPAETIRLAVFLIGNLARDEAADLVRQIHPRTSADASTPAPAAETRVRSAREEGERSSPKPKRFWIGAAFAYDLVAAPGAGDACTLSMQALPTTPYDCTANGLDFPSRASNAGDQSIDIVPGESDSVAGGLVPGNFRILASFDYAATENVLVGLRLGYVGKTYNGAAATQSVESRTMAAPFDAEVRATYVLGDDPFAKAGLAPYAMIGAGVSQYSAQVGVTVVSAACARIKGTSTNPTAYQSQCTDSPPPPPCPSNSTSCTTNAQAWVTAGPWFASLGVGLRYAVTPEVAFLFGPRFNLSFGGPTVLPSVSPELGVQYGF
jgi:hypothetical protein